MIDLKGLPPAPWTVAITGQRGHFKIEEAAKLEAAHTEDGVDGYSISSKFRDAIASIPDTAKEIRRLRDENANLDAACKIADRKNEALCDLLTAASGAHEFFSGVSFSDLAELTEANIHCERMEAAIKQAKARMKCP